MYYIQLYTDSYTQHSDLIEVPSTLLPRPGDVVEDESGTYLVFDVTHQLKNRKLIVIVRAREASRADRFFNFAENGYLDTRDESRHGSLEIDDRQFSSVEQKLPTCRIIPHPGIKRNG